MLISKLSGLSRLPKLLLLTLIVLPILLGLMLPTLLRKPYLC